MIFCQALFSKFFVISDFSVELGAFSVSRSLAGTFGRLLVLFALLPSWDSEVILLSQRLALTYSTISQLLLQVFFSFFSPFFAFCIHRLVFCLVSGNVLTFSPFLPIPFLPIPFLPIYKSCRTKYRAAAFALWLSFFLPASSPAGSARQPLPALAGRRSDRWA